MRQICTLSTLDGARTRMKSSKKTPSPKKAPRKVSDRHLLLQLLASLTLCDTVGDVGDAVIEVFTRLGIPLDNSGDTWEDDVRKTLAKLGVTSLCGTSLDSSLDNPEDT